MNKNVFLLPIKDGGLTKAFNKTNHLGCDFGFYDYPNDKVFAIQDGVCVSVFNSKTMGHGCVLQHNYADGTHRWSAYIHLQKVPLALKGKFYEQGAAIGYRGNTGSDSRGTHLHIYVSDCTKKEYSWDLMKSLCTFDPFPYFYKSHKFTYTLATLPKYKMLELKYMDDETETVQKLNAQIAKLETDVKNEEAEKLVLKGKLEDIQKILSE